MRPTLDELVLSSCRLNVDAAAVIAVNRLTDFTRGTPPGTRYGVILFKTPDSALPRHLSKTSCNTLSNRSSAGQDDVSAQGDSDSTITEVHADLGGPSRLVMHFRPNFWRHLERNRSTLNLDLFWPLKPDLDEEDEESDVFPLNDMRPLYDFRHLRSLQLNGMLQSYQKYI